jgi:hypothetical protein
MGLFRDKWFHFSAEYTGLIFKRRFQLLKASPAFFACRKQAKKYFRNARNTLFYVVTCLAVC